MPGPSQSFDTLAKWAREGDENAANRLALRAPRHKYPTFETFLRRYVPKGELTEPILERFYRAWQRAEHERARAALDAIEIPIPETKETA